MPLPPSQPSASDTTIIFDSPINVSVQPGDALYESIVTTASPGQTFDTLGTPTYVGWITEVGVSHKKVDGTPTDGGGFYSFLKDNSINSASVIGEWAEVTIKNNSREKAEIFTISSEVAPNSK